MVVDMREQRSIGWVELFYLFLLTILSLCVRIVYSNASIQPQDLQNILIERSEERRVGKEGRL